MRRSPTFVKLTNWEHWPTLMFYIPLLPFFLIRSIRAGHPIFYTIANPAILFSGNGTESKFQTLNLLPQKFRPKSFILKKNDLGMPIEEQLKKHSIDFPLIAKPDIGFRGYLVKKMETLEQLKKYIHRIGEDVLIQEFIPYENELGIFYHRIPGQKKGKITSVTIKKFIKVKGNGLLTLSQLVQQDERAFIYAKLFKILHRQRYDSILGKNEELTLSVIGNHSKGTEFINGNHLISDHLETFIDDLCQQIEGWYYGRLDIKYEDYEKLLNGEAFKILEINGIISEPTHIYDASYQKASYLGALRSINKHWDIMAKIARKNHKERKIPYPSVMAYAKNMLWLRSHTRKLKKLNSLEF